MSAQTPEAAILEKPRGSTPRGSAAMTPFVDTFDRTLASARSTVAFRETLRLALDSFKASKVRFLLTMLGMVIGSASIVLVVTVGLTGKQYALDQISGLGPNKVEMGYKGGVVFGPDNVGVRDDMTIEDMNAVNEEVPGVVASSPMLEIDDRVALGNGQTIDAQLLGVAPKYRKVRNLKVLAGRFFDDEDSLTHAKVVVMVGPMANELYGSYNAAIGKTISFKGIPLSIIGVFVESMDTYGQSEISRHTMLMPYEVGRYFTGTDTVKELFFTIDRAEDVPADAVKITDVIRSRHRPTSVYEAQTLTDILKTMARIADMLTIVLTLAAFITLVVSGVGIMNSMLANVQSRIREIGIRKAMGATRREILTQFLTESVFLSLTGGLVGTLVGLALPLSVRFLTDFKIPISPWSAVIALLTSVIVGVVFGTLPAQRAAKLDPVTTLKSD